MSITTGLDFFFRFAAIGQLLLLIALVAWRGYNLQRLALTAMLVAAGAFLLLTLPIEDEAYGYWRNVLLLLTDLWTFFLWLLVASLFIDNFRPSQWAWYWKGLLSLWGLILVWLFLLHDGNHWLHDANHALSVLLIAHALVMAIGGLKDDLVDARRRIRLAFVVSLSVYFFLLLGVELASSPLRSSSWYGLVNSAWVFFVLTLSASFLLSPGKVEYLQAVLGPAVPETSDRAAEVFACAEDEALAGKLQHFVDSGRYREGGISVTSLAQQLDCQEYRLRRLINKQLGFRNFSAFLNHYRIADACQRLLSEPDLPVLSVALDVGFGSIGPFNRAFRAANACSPTQYRVEFQNRR